MSDPRRLETSSPKAPDGAHLIFIGTEPNGALDWWIVHRQGGDVHRLGVAERLRSQGIPRLVPQDMSFDWLGGEMVVAIRGEEVANIWGIPVSRTRPAASGPARRLTFGSATTELWPRISAGGDIVFSSDFHVTHLWSVNLADPDSPPEQLTSDASLLPGDFRDAEGFSSGKNILVFSSRRSGNRDLWAKDLATGREWKLAASKELEEDPLLSPDGSFVAYTVSTAPRRSLYLLDVLSGRSRKVCHDCSGLYAWTPDGKNILYGLTAGRSRSLVAFDVAGGESIPWIETTNWAIRHLAVSPNWRWAAVTTENSDGIFLDLWLARVAVSSSTSAVSVA